MSTWAGEEQEKGWGDVECARKQRFKNATVTPGMMGT